MITQEPVLNVGIVEGYTSLRGLLDGDFVDENGAPASGPFDCAVDGPRLVVRMEDRKPVSSSTPLTYAPRSASARVHLHDVTIGVKFHWERKENQVFRGGMRLLTRPGRGIIAVNTVPLEEYLTSVISSEMSATAPPELLRAHAITSRSWLVAMLDRATHPTVPPPPPPGPDAEEIVRWYTREDHDLYDVCADDHCQRYQGITRILSPVAAEAVRSTRGLFLVSDDRICDARFYKACGGRTEEFPNAWEDTRVPYLQSITDGPTPTAPVDSEESMERWITDPPDAYCNTTDGEILRQILPSFDQETTDFFRWAVTRTREELESLIKEKSGIDIGTLQDLQPLHRGPSGRITRLRIVGSRRTVTVGKELEIRRWLSPSHLYSSAFIVEAERNAAGIVERFTLRGSGWGHGVGLCQIGAAVMATRGFSAEAIVRHYFPGAQLRTLYR